MTDDDKWREAAEALVAIDHQKGRVLMEAEKDYEVTKDIGELERAKSTLLAAIQNGPRYHPSVVPTPLTDEIIDDAFDHTLRPNAWKAETIAKVEAENQAKYPINIAAHNKEGQRILQRRLISCSASVLITGIAFLIH
jgi:hypothetical protein